MKALCGSFVMRTSIMWYFRGLSELGFVAFHNVGLQSEALNNAWCLSMVPHNVGPHYVVLHNAVLLCTSSLRGVLLCGASLNLLKIYADSIYIVFVVDLKESTIISAIHLSVPFPSSSRAPFTEALRYDHQQEHLSP